MKKKHRVSVLLLVAALGVFAQETWIRQSSGTVQPLNAIRFLGANTATGYIVGSNCPVLKTTDGGTNWNSDCVNTGVLRGIFFLNDDTGYAVGSEGLMFRIIHGLCQTYSSETTKNLNAVFILNSGGNTGFVVGDSGLIRENAFPGGWLTHTSGTVQNLNAVHFVNDSNGYAVGAAGTILTTTNGGKNWVSQTSGTTQDLNSVSFVDANTGYVVGNGGLILKTVNGGAAWTELNSGTSVSLNSVRFLNSNLGFSVGGNGAILKTNDGGASWLSQNSGRKAVLRSVYFSDSTTGYVAGDSGTILKAAIIPTGLAKHSPDPAFFSLNNEGWEYNLTRRTHVQTLLLDIRGRQILKLTDAVQDMGQYRMPVSSATAIGSYLLDFRTDDFHRTFFFRNP